MGVNITINKQDLNELRKVYLSTKAEGKDTFVWRGHQLLVSYAQYLIEYAEMRLDA